MLETTTTMVETTTTAEVTTTADTTTTEYPTANKVIICLTVGSGS
jgi:hypothetical protein